MKPSRLFILALFVAGATSTLFAACGCDSRPPAPVAPDKLRIFSTVYAINDIAREVGGKYVETAFAIESGQSLGDFQPGAELRRRMNQCEIVMAGGAVDEWAVADSSNPMATQRVIRFDALARQTDQSGTGLLWLDPVAAQQACDELAKRLATLRPSHAAYFNSQAKQLKDRLELVIAEYRGKFDRAERRRVMALSPEFDPLGTRFNVDIVHPLSTTADRLTDDQLRHLQQTSHDEHIVTLIVRSDTPPALVRDLSRRTGFQIITLDAYGSSAATGRDTYESLLKYDLDQLLNAVNAR